MEENEIAASTGSQRSWPISGTRSRTRPTWTGTAPSASPSSRSSMHRTLSLSSEDQPDSVFTFLHVCLLFGRFKVIPVILIKSYHKQHFQVHYPRPTSLNSLKVVSSRRKIVFLLTGNFSSCLNWIFNKFWHWIRHISFVYYCLVFTNNHPFSPHCFLNSLGKFKSPSFSNIFLDA